jgi:glycosyltransferase involved in cell wall biosynthesis
MASWQGLSTLIEAMPIILAAWPEAELHLVGPAKSRQRKRLAKLAAKLGLDEESVRILGQVPPEEIPKQLRGASVCLAPLTYNDRNVVQGCCPIKVLEYAAAGRPIVAADLPAVRELLREGEALFFDAGDATALARQVIYLLSHPQEAQAMAERAAQRVGKTLTWARAGERLLEAYAPLIEKAPTRIP